MAEDEGAGDDALPNMALKPKFRVVARARLKSTVVIDTDDGHQEVDLGPPVREDNHIDSPSWLQDIPLPRRLAELAGYPRDPDAAIRWEELARQSMKLNGFNRESNCHLNNDPNDPTAAFQWDIKLTRNLKPQVDVEDPSTTANKYKRAMLILDTLWLKLKDAAGVPQNLDDMLDDQWYSYSTAAMVNILFASITGGAGQPLQARAVRQPLAVPVNIRPARTGAAAQAAAEAQPVAPPGVPMPGGAAGEAEMEEEEEAPAAAAEPSSAAAAAASKEEEGFGEEGGGGGPDFDEEVQSCPRAKLDLFFVTARCRRLGDMMWSNDFLRALANNLPLPCRDADPTWLAPRWTTYPVIETIHNTLTVGRQPVGEAFTFQFFNSQPAVTQFRAQQSRRASPPPSESSSEEEESESEEGAAPAAPAARAAASGAPAGAAAAAAAAYEEQEAQFRAQQSAFPPPSESSREEEAFGMQEGAAAAAAAAAPEEEEGMEMEPGGAGQEEAPEVAVVPPPMRQALPERYYFFNVPGDGNCFYYAFYMGEYYNNNNYKIKKVENVDDYRSQKDKNRITRENAAIVTPYKDAMWSYFDSHKKSALPQFFEPLLISYQHEATEKLAQDTVFRDRRNPQKDETPVSYWNTLTPEEKAAARTQARQNLYKEDARNPSKQAFWTAPRDADALEILTLVQIKNVTLVVFSCKTYDNFKTLLDTAAVQGSLVSYEQLLAVADPREPINIFPDERLSDSRPTIYVLRQRNGSEHYAALLPVPGATTTLAPPSFPPPPAAAAAAVPFPPRAAAAAAAAVPFPPRAAAAAAAATLAPPSIPSPPPLSPAVQAAAAAAAPTVTMEEEEAPPLPELTPPRDVAAVLNPGPTVLLPKVGSKQAEFQTRGRAGLRKTVSKKTSTTVKFVPAGRLLKKALPRQKMAVEEATSGEEELDMTEEAEPAGVKGAAAGEEEPEIRELIQTWDPPREIEEEVEERMKEDKYKYYKRFRPSAPTKPLVALTKRQRSESDEPGSSMERQVVGDWTWPVDLTFHLRLMDNVTPSSSGKAKPSNVPQLDSEFWNKPCSQLENELARDTAEVQQKVNESTLFKNNFVGNPIAPADRTELARQKGAIDRMRKEYIVKAERFLSYCKKNPPKNIPAKLSTWPGTPLELQGRKRFSTFEMLTGGASEQQDAAFWDRFDGLYTGLLVKRVQTTTFPVDMWGFLKRRKSRIKGLSKEQVNELWTNTETYFFEKRRMAFVYLPTLKAGWIAAPFDFDASHVALAVTCTSTVLQKLENETLGLLCQQLGVTFEKSQRAATVKAVAATMLKKYFNAPTVLGLAPTAQLDGALLSAIAEARPRLHQFMRFMPDGPVTAYNHATAQNLTLRLGYANLKLLELWTLSTKTKDLKLLWSSLCFLYKQLGYEYLLVSDIPGKALHQFDAATNTCKDMPFIKFARVKLQAHPLTIEKGKLVASSTKWLDYFTYYAAPL